jgi:hypothetical protein
VLPVTVLLLDEDMETPVLLLLQVLPVTVLLLDEDR